MKQSEPPCAPTELVGEVGTKPGSDWSRGRDSLLLLSRISRSNCMLFSVIQLLTMHLRSGAKAPVGGALWCSAEQPDTPPNPQDRRQRLLIPSDLLELPDELLEHVIASGLSPRDLCALSCCNGRLSALSSVR